MRVIQTCTCAELVSASRFMGFQKIHTATHTIHEAVNVHHAMAWSLSGLARSKACLEGEFVANE